MEWYFWTLIGAFILIILLLVFGSALLFKMTVKREEGDDGISVWDKTDGAVKNPTLLPYADRINSEREYVRSKLADAFTVESFDGLKLKARFVPAENQRAIVLMMHGYRTSPLHDFSCAVRDFNERGISCFLPYQRAHGDSEGKYICFGTKEKYDVLTWCRLIEEKFPGVPVFLDGVSMGAVSVLMASGLPLPQSVKGIIADSGYTSPIAAFKWVCRRAYGMSPFPFVYTASAAMRLVAGFKAGEKVKTALKKNTLPVFFAHGEADTLVPCAMGLDNYETALKTCDAVLFTVPEAEHGISYLVDREGYLNELDKFIDKCIK